MFENKLFLIYDYIYVGSCSLLLKIGLNLLCIFVHHLHTVLNKILKIEIN